VLVTVALLGHADGTTFRENIRSDYAQIVHYLSQMAFDELAVFESIDIKCGFGPGEEGPGCIRQMLERDSACLNKVLFALNQGCELEQKSAGLQCTAPPQWNNDNIILPSVARATFIFDASKSRLLIQSLICGGD